jgi:hypothetical protein
LFGDLLCASNTGSIWYLVSRGEPTYHRWRKIETYSSCDRWGHGSGVSLDPMCKREILERDLSLFRTSCVSEIIRVGLGLTSKKELPVHMRPLMAQYVLLLSDSNWRRDGLWLRLYRL